MYTLYTEYAQNYTHSTPTYRTYHTSHVYIHDNNHNNIYIYDAHRIRTRTTLQRIAHTNHRMYIYTIIIIIIYIYTLHTGYAHAQHSYVWRTPHIADKTQTYLRMHTTPSHIIHTTHRIHMALL